MKKDIKKKWLKALRSGEYKKATGSLKTTSGFCCLGVLSDLYIKEHTTGRGKAEWVDRNGDIAFETKGESETGVLPSAVVRWAGLKDDAPKVSFTGTGKDEDGQIGLINLNDDKGFSFARIADKIEASL